MANKRMFSLKIVDTDAFLDMPQSSQLLYFHFSMRADDDGFVSNPKKIMRMIGSQEDDYKVLLVKRFLIPFESGVCVIKHWHIHNVIRQDRYTSTTYLREKSRLIIKENKSYTLNKLNVIPNGNQVAPQIRLGKVSIGKDSIDKKSKELAKQSFAVRKDQSIFDLIELFKPINPCHDRLFANKTQRACLDRLLKKMGQEKLEGIISFLEQTNKMPFSPTITTPSELESKLGSLVAFLQKKGIEMSKNKIVKI